MSYELIKRNYDRGLYTKAMVKVAVRKGVLTKAEYQQITGEPYTK